MFHEPVTKEEAMKYRYGVWRGNPRGREYQPECCAAEVSDSTGWTLSQCLRKSGHGPGGLYCKQHAKMVTQDAQEK